MHEKSTPPPSTAELITRELLANVASLALLPFGIGESRKRTPRRREQSPIVFVHGYASNRSLFLPLSAYLGALGLGPRLFFNYRFAEGVEAAAVRLERFLSKNVRGGRITLVCHSLGGVIARLYLQDLGGARRVDRCITIATPHRGTYNAYWLLSRVAHEMRPDSELIARLETGRARASGVKFTSILGAADNIVLPRESAGEGDDVVPVPRIGHMGLLFNATVFQEVARRLL